MIAKLKQMETEFTSLDDLDGLGGVQHARASDPSRQARVERRAMDWLIGMQSADGGWAAFDVDNDWQLLNKVPFADHNAMLDSTLPRHQRTRDGGALPFQKSSSRCRLSISGAGSLPRGEFLVSVRIMQFHELRYVAEMRRKGPTAR
jgi:Squalene-hopene cyclase C-terminal domain